MKGRNLVVMFDGTWDTEVEKSNVARMCRALAGVHEGMKQLGVHEGMSEEARDGEPVKQLVKYITGVGTGVKAKATGGAFGYGLCEKLKEGYRWLSQKYQPHDQIFVFGFSRGAFTARALVSLVHKCGGLLKPDDDPRKRSWDNDADREQWLVEEAYKLYSEVVADEKDFPDYLERVKQFGRWNCRKVRVKMIGVWDTVGALALPDSFLKPDKTGTWSNDLLQAVCRFLRERIPGYMTREHYRFFDQSLPCIVDEAYHALAIDEDRLHFPPHIWDSRKILDPADQTDYLIVPKEQKVKQCWFAGSHCNVGGGIDKDPEAPRKLSYEWMQGKAEKAGLMFTEFHKSNAESWQWQGDLEDSYASFADGLYKLVVKRIHRAIIREYVPKMSMEGSRAEKLHRSVKLRMENNPRYRPLALECHAKEFGSAYESATNKDDLNKETAFVYSDTGKKYHTVIPFDPMVPKECTCKRTPRFHPPFDGYYRDNYVYRHPLILENRLASGDGKTGLIHGLGSYFFQPL